MAKSIIVTGAAGFIGFHLSRFLAKRGDRVIGVDNFNSYYSPKLKQERARILESLEIPVIQGDICQASFLDPLIEEHQTTHLCHLAAQAGVRYSLENPLSYIKNNLEGFTQILECCRRFPAIKLTYASSSSVYGLNEKSPFSIEDPTDRQASLYGATKKGNELIAHAYHHLYGIHVTGLRYFTVYGPWGRPDMAYMSFAEKIWKGEPIDIYNHGKMKRDFTYIDDIVAGTAAAIDLGAPCELFNLGNHKPVELLQFIECLEDALGKKGEKRFLPMQPGDVAETYADISRSQEKLGFHPKTPLERGIPQFVDWFKGNRYSEFLLR